MRGREENLLYMKERSKLEPLLAASTHMHFANGTSTMSDMAKSYTPCTARGEASHCLRIQTAYGFVYPSMSAMPLQPCTMPSVMDE